MGSVEMGVHVDVNWWLESSQKIRYCAINMALWLLTMMLGRADVQEALTDRRHGILELLVDHGLTGRP